MEAFANIVIEWILHDYILFSDVPRNLIMCVQCRRCIFCLVDEHLFACYSMFSNSKSKVKG